MTELEDRLRDMLQDRSGDIDTIPDRLLEIGAGDTITPPTDITIGRHRGTRSVRSRAWLLSAAAIAVIALGLGLLFGVRGDSDRRPAEPVGPTTVAPTPTSAPTRTSLGPRTAVSLDWFGLSPVENFTVAIKASVPGSRFVGWHRDGDQAQPTGSNGGGDLSAKATVFPRGGFSPRRTPLDEDVPTTVTTRSGPITVHRGQMLRLQDNSFGPDLVPTVTWEYSAGAYVVVQALTDPVSATDLLDLVAAVRPQDTVAITLPFRLASAPPGRIEQIIDSRPAYPLIVTFRDGDTRTTEFQLKSDSDRRTDFTGATARRVGGLPGYLIAADGGYVDYAGGVLTVSKNAGDKLDATGINRLFDGLTWSGGNGSGPGIPLRDAIGR